MDENTGGPAGPPLRKDDVTMDTNTQEVSRYDVNNKYSCSDQGPFFVYLEHKNKNLGRLFPIKIGYFLQQVEELKKDIVDIKSIGLKRVKVEFKSYSRANLLINHDVVLKNELIAFIPKFYTQKRGVVRMVDTFFAEDYLKNAIISDSPVVEVKRMKRKIVNSETKAVEYVNRQTIIVTFLGNKIPDSIKINMVNFTVDPYIYPVVQCFKCLRYGHTSVQCKGVFRCQRCSKEHPENEECISEIMCIHCNSKDHISTSKDCPVHTKQHNIKKIMAYKNASFKEAEALLNNPSYSKVVTNNKFDLLKNVDNFPELPILSNSYSNSLIRKPKPRTENPPKITSQSKKRKHSSPPRTPILTTPSTSALRVSDAHGPIIPNPHYDDFVAYKDQIICQISTFINGIIKNPKPLDENKIKDYLISIFSNNGDNTFDTITITSDDDDTY